MPATASPLPRPAVPVVGPPADEQQRTTADERGPGPGFAALGLPDPLLRAVMGLGFTEPTAIQAAAVPPLLAGRDLTGIAQTGTGKTAAFGLPLLAAVDPAAACVQALVLTPTRELALQVASAVTDLATHSGVDVVPVYGGASFGPQLRGLARGAQVVVGTPGRVLDLAGRGSLDLACVRYLVLDEADEMLRMGFAEDVEQILAHTPRGRQVALFSATMPPAIRGVAGRHLSDPVEVATSRQSSTVATVSQGYAVVPYRHKLGALTRVLATTEADAALVFVRTRGAAQDVGASLVAAGIAAASISGDVAQRERERVVGRLRSGSLDVLVATDVAARGLDVDRVGLVVNFDVPTEPEAYVHRIGRTGRAGRSGRAVTFVAPHERGRLRAVERLTRTRLAEVPIPTPAEVAEHRARYALGRAAERMAAGRLDHARDAVGTFAREHGLDGTDLAAALLALLVGDDDPAGADSGSASDVDVASDPAPVLDVPGGGPDRSERDHPAGSRGERAPRRPGTSGPRPARAGVSARYRVAVGHEHGARPESIVGAITGEGGLRGSDLGRIDIYPRFSLVEITAELTPATSRRIGAAVVAGRPLRIRVDAGPPHSRRDLRRAGPPATGPSPAVPRSPGRRRPGNRS